MFRNLFNTILSPAAFSLAMIAFSLNGLADPPGAPGYGGTTTGGGGGSGMSSGSSSGTSGGTTTGGGGGSGMSSGSSSGTSGGTTTGGGGGSGMSSGSSSGTSGGIGGTATGGSGGLSFGPGFDSTPSPCNGCGQSNLGFGPNFEASDSTTGSDLGYSMGTAVSVDDTGLSSVGGTTVSGSGSESGGSGGYSLGTAEEGTSSSRAVVHSILMGLGNVTGTTAAVQTFSAGLRRVAASIGSTVARVAETAARTINVHASASAAGYQNMVNSVRGSVGAGSVGYREALDAAYYRGVTNYYDRHRITSRMAPTGPMSIIHGPVAVAQDPALQAIDRRFNAGTISVVGTRLGYNRGQMIATIGQAAYQNLSNYQRFGFFNSTVVIGDLTGTGLLAPTSLGEYFASGSVIAVDTAIQDDFSVAESVQHEASHAADFAVRNLVDRVLGSPSSSVPGSLRTLAESIENTVNYRAAGNVYTGWVAENFPVDFGGSIAHGPDATPQTQRAQNWVEYSMRTTEMTAFNSNEADRRVWAENNARNLGITQAEARDLLDEFQEVYQQEDIDAFIEAVQEIGL